MWTVSVLLEADRYKPSILNANEQMLTHLRYRESLSELYFVIQKNSVPAGIHKCKLKKNV